MLPQIHDWKPHIKIWKKLRQAIVGDTPTKFDSSRNNQFSLVMRFLANKNTNFILIKRIYQNEREINQPCQVVNSIGTALSFLYDINTIFSLIYSILRCTTISMLLIPMLCDLSNRLERTS